MSIHRIKKIFKYPRRYNWLLIEATCYSACYEICLRLNWFRFIRNLHQNKEQSELTADQILLVRHVNSVMKKCEKFLPWKPMCYNRALTAKKLLLKRGVETEIHIGFKKNIQKNEFDGHAWLTYKKFFITGKVKGLNKYQKLTPIK